MTTYAIYLYNVHVSTFFFYFYAKKCFGYVNMMSVGRTLRLTSDPQMTSCIAGEVQEGFKILLAR